MDVDDCYSNVVGTFGKYQIFICISTAWYSAAGAGIAVMPVFTAANVTELHKVNSRVKNDSSFLVEWDLVDEVWLSDFIQAFYFLGFLIGVVLIGQISDKFGRKNVLRIGFSALFPLCYFTSYASSWQVLTAFRFFVGFLGGGVGLVLYVYVQECIGQKWWAFTCALQGCFFPLGLILYALVSYCIPAWRMLVRVITILQLPPLIVIFFLKESPRWLYSKNHIKEAEEVLVYFAKRNGVCNPKCNLKPIVVEKVDKNPSLMNVMKNYTTLKRLVVMGYMWFVVSFVYYALTLAAGKLGSNLYATFALSGLLELVVHIFAPFLLNSKLGRKLSSCISFLIGGFSCFFLMAFNPQDKPVAMTVVGLIGKISISFAFTCVYTYSPELFPTYVRNVAIGAVSMCARIGGILSSFATSFITLHPIVGYFTFGCCGVTAGLFCLMLPETRGRKPPNSFKELDDEVIFYEKQKNSFKMKKQKSFEKEHLLESDAEDEDIV